MATEVIFPENVHERGRPRWSLMRSRLLDHSPEDAGAFKDRDITDFLNANICLPHPKEYIYTTEKVPFDASRTKLIDSQAPRKKKAKHKSSEQKKQPKKRKDREVKFVIDSPDVIGEGGDGASLPANQVRSTSQGVVGEVESEVQRWEKQLQRGLHMSDSDASKILPPTVNCSTVKRRPRVRRIPAFEKVKTEQADAVECQTAETGKNITPENLVASLGTRENHFVDGDYSGLHAPTWHTNSQGWPEPSILPSLVTKMAPSKQQDVLSDACPEALQLSKKPVSERHRSSNHHMTSAPVQHSQILDIHPAALSLRPKASPRGSIRSLRSHESISTLSISSQPEVKPRRESTSSRTSSKSPKASSSLKSTHIVQQQKSIPQRHPEQLKPQEKIEEKPLELNPLTYVPPDSSNDVRSGRTRVRAPETTSEEQKEAIVGQPAIPEKNPNRNHLAALPDCTRRPSAAFLHHREEAFSNLVHPAFRRSSVDSMISRSSVSRSPMRHQSQRSSRNPSIAIKPEMVNEDSAPEMDDEDELSDSMKSFDKLTSQLSFQMSLPSIALPISKHSTLKWLQTAIYWFLRGRQGITKYILLLRNGAPAGSHLNSDNIAKILTQQHVNFFKTRWIVNEIVRERLVALAGSEEMYCGEGEASEGDKNADLFDLADVLVERFKEVVAWLDEHDMLPEADAEGCMRLGAGRLDMCLWFSDEGFTGDLEVLRERLIRPWRIG